VTPYSLENLTPNGRPSPYSPPSHDKHGQDAVPESPTRPRRPLRNVRQEACHQAIVAAGYDPERRGYPDFWFVRNNRLFYIHVKPEGRTKIRVKQQQFLERAAAAGALCYRWDPAWGFRPVGHETPFPVDVQSGKQ
jgi:hypothetical protein